jgi:hypothetical protein
VQWTLDEEKKSHMGTLTEVNQDTIVLDDRGTLVEIPLKAISKAKTVFLGLPRGMKMSVNILEAVIKLAAIKQLDGVQIQKSSWILLPAHCPKSYCLKMNWKYSSILLQVGLKRHLSVW